MPAIDRSVTSQIIDCPGLCRSHNRQTIVNVTIWAFSQLCQIISVGMRSPVCCMHLDEMFDVQAAEQAGFKVARSALE